VTLRTLSQELHVDPSCLSNHLLVPRGSRAEIGGHAIRDARVGKVNIHWHQWMTGSCNSLPYTSKIQALNSARRRNRIRSFPGNQSKIRLNQGKRRFNREPCLPSLLRTKQTLDPESGTRDAVNGLFIVAPIAKGCSSAPRKLNYG
jgi:hypothetical protein